MSEPVIIEYPNGAQYQIESAERAAEMHPDAKVVSYYDGRPYDAAPPETGTPATPPVASPVVPVATQPAVAVAQPVSAQPQGSGQFAAGPEGAH